MILRANLAGSADHRKYGGIFTGGYKLPCSPEEAAGMAIRGERSDDASLGRFLDDVLFRNARPCTLLYHFCPWMGRPEMIAFHLRRLAWHLPRFSKVRVNIATGRDFLPPELIETAIRRLCRTSDVVFFRNDNSGALGEVNPFFKCLLPCVGDDDLVCYGHTKAAMRTVLPQGKMWADLMYAHTMGNSQIAEMVGDLHDCSGSFARSHTKHGGSWIYSGTFFWFKGVRKYQGWRSHPPNRFGVENWLGCSVPKERAVFNMWWKDAKAMMDNVDGMLDRYCRVML